MDDQAIMGYLQALGLGSGMPQGGAGQPGQVPQMQTPPQNQGVPPPNPQAAPVMPQGQPQVQQVPVQVPMMAAGPGVNYALPPWLNGTAAPLTFKIGGGGATPAKPPGGATSGSGNLGDGATPPDVMGAGGGGFSFGGMF